MAILAKMAEMVINRRNRQIVNKNSNEMAKWPFGKLRFWQKWRKLRLIAEIGKLETKIQMRWQWGTLESRDFGENSVFGKNDGNGD